MVCFMYVFSQERRRAGYRENKTIPTSPPSYAELLPPASTLSEHTNLIIEALESIKTTPFENSFLSRLYGVACGDAIARVVSVDWETVTPWMSVMNDVREHYTLAQ